MDTLHHISSNHCLSPILLLWHLHCSVTSKATAYGGVYFHSVPPRIIPFHFEEHIRAGSLVQVICVVGEGDSPIDIRWTLHGEEVRPKLGIFTQRVGERTSILSIDRVGSEHRGSYTCLASNHAGRTNHTETLWVNGMLNNGCHIAELLLMIQHQLRIDFEYRSALLIYVTDL